MTDKEKELEHLVRNMYFDDVPDDRHRAKLEHRLLAALARQARPDNVWRITMRHPLTKVAAAVIVVAALLSTSLWQEATPPVYALEQIIEANRGIRSIHARFYESTERLDKNQSDLCWIRYNEEGLISNFRWNHTEDDGSVCHSTWNEGIYKSWMPCKNVLIVEKRPKFGFWGFFTQMYNPISALGELHTHAQKNKAIRLTIREPVQDGEPMYVEATHENSRTVLVIDPETKRVKQLSTYDLNNPKHDRLGIQVDYLAYNQPIDESVFELNAIPDDARVLDYANVITGLEQGDLTDHEIAAKVVRTALEAFIAQDHKGAMKLMAGEPERTIEEFLDATSAAKSVKLISVGRPEPHWTWPVMLCVPCEIEVENKQGISWRENITVTAQKIKRTGSRWVIAGENPSHSPVAYLETPIVKGTAIPIVPGLGVGDYRLGMSKDDLIAKLGKPNDISWKDEHFTLDNLPRLYYMRFDGGIYFLLAENSVRVIGVTKPFYKFANGLGVGDSELRIKQALGDDFQLIESKWRDLLYYQDKGLKLEIHKQRRTVTEISVAVISK